MTQRYEATRFFDEPARVRYSETDQMEVAYYANYLVWFEVGRAEYCRHNGFAYADMERDAGCYLVVAEASCRYRRPLRYDQAFIIRTWTPEVRRRSVTFAYELLGEDRTTVHATGFTKHVVTGRDGRPRTFPSPYRELLVAAMQDKIE